MADPIYVRQGQGLTPEDEAKIAARLRATAPKEPPVADMRRQVADALRAEEERMAQQDQLGAADPADVSRALRARDTAKSGEPAPQAGVLAGRSVAGQLEPGESGPALIPATPAGQMVGGSMEVGGRGGGYGGSYTVPKNPGRTALNTLSGGVTEKVNAAVETAPAQAKEQVTEKGLSGISAEERIRAFIAATGATPQQAQQFVRVNPSWVPGQRTAATGVSGMDPEARDEIMTLQKGSEVNQEEAFKQTQDANSLLYQQMLDVQKNKLEAEQRFRDEHKGIQQRYDTERAQQMAELQRIQDAMGSLGKQPRTIREWLDSSGTGKQVTYGLAAALSALGGAIGRRGNQPLQDLFNRTQANINAKVEQEKETHARLGEQAKLNDTIYTRIRQASSDDQAALNITKAMYYDAVGQMVEQVATQYKLDTQSPQLLDFMSKLAKERQSLIADTATKIQEQSSQTDRFNPGGVFAVGGSGGGADSKGPSAGEKDVREQVEKFGLEMEKRGANVTAQTIEHYQNLIGEMKKTGMDKDEMLWGALAQAATAKDPVKATAVIAALPEKQKQMVSLLLQANERRLHKLSGANLTTGEVIRDMFKQGSYSIDGLMNFNNELKAEWEGTVRGVEGTYGGEPAPEGGTRIGNLYKSRYDWAGISSPYTSVNGRALNPLTPEEKRRRDSAKVQ